MTKHDVPRSLHRFIGSDFEELVDMYVPADYADSIEEATESVEDNMQQILDDLDDAIRGRPIYRAIKVNNVRQHLGLLSKGCVKRGDCGKHWSAYIDGADVDWDECDHSKGWYDESDEDEEVWKEGDGIIIIEGIITDPSSINFDHTLQERFYWGHEVGKGESEITIEDDTAIKITRLGAGTTVGRARRNLLEQGGR